MEEKRKEYKIKKISDQKDGYKDGYEFYRNLEIGDNELPLESELLTLRNIEIGKNVAFIIGESNISLICYYSDCRFISNVKKEYKRNWDEDNVKEVVVATFAKNVEALSKKISELRSLESFASSNEKPPVRKK